MKYNIQKKYFEEKYKTKNNIWSIIPTGKEAKNFLRLMKKYKPKGRMVDLGCGNGKFARFFAKNGFFGYGIDYVLEVIKEAKKLATEDNIGKRTYFKVGDVLSMDYPTHFFDFAYDYGCLHHIKKRDWGQYLRNILRILKKDGFFMLSMFSKNTIKHFGFYPKKSKQNWVIHKEPENYLHYDHFFTKEEILNLFSKDFNFINIVEKKLDLNQIFQKIKPNEKLESTKDSSFPVFFHVQMKRK